MFSATLHSPEIRELSQQLCSFPTWVDLKGRDSVPETVTHLLVPIDPTRDSALWAAMRPLPPNDDVHSRDSPSPSSPAPESRSFGIKCLKLLKLIQLMDSLKMSQCMIFLPHKFGLRQPREIPRCTWRRQKICRASGKGH
jgi:ATP-dependent RNA helicase DDX1